MLHVYKQGHEAWTYYSNPVTHRHGSNNLRGFVNLACFAMKAWFVRNRKTEKSSHCSSPKKESLSLKVEENFHNAFAAGGRRHGLR